ncbi:lipid A-modifier LpxR family protein [Phenylobacterium sp. NIBR 498073]|uniref:lipid A-modifier LpxR family protein n=1 Tax=Phenylobacterium sp. NIBR 498073 TaxID=3015177 RepID=UPI0022B34E32|nr:lipid A-modifier LpxR family protein [Phenylobacterium sp. NIBR 498073]WGU39932.1 DUF2219 family protein [Phenylobacterium sp. NIBR 498073]
MRLLAGLAIALCFGAATEGAAQTSRPGGDTELKGAGFAPDKAPKIRQDDFANLVEREQFAADGAPVRWTTNNFQLGKTARGSIDTMRLSVGGTERSPSGLPANIDPRAAQFDADAYEVAVTRDWAPVRFGAGELDVALTPHTGVGLSNSGGQAEAGATLTVAQKRDGEVEDRLNDLGVRDGKAYGDQGRWYLFAAASGRAVGLNVLRNGNSWDRQGFTTDPSSALVGDAHVGVAYRKGALQTSFGYIHREVKGEHMVFGQETKEDSVLAFTFSIKPQK